jgi:hypothetical protein
MNNMNKQFKNAIPIFDIDLQKKMTGREKYPILGNTIPHQDIKNILCQFEGLLLTANCLEKAKIVKQYLKTIWGYHVIIISGSICITWCDTQYGYHFNPPLEFHAWNYVEIKDSIYILDLSLPGVIIRGKKFKDEKGNFLEGLPEFILNGRQPEFIQYQSEEIL